MASLREIMSDPDFRRMNLGDQVKAMRHFGASDDIADAWLQENLGAQAESNAARLAPAPPEADPEQSRNIWQTMGPGGRGSFGGTGNEGGRLAAGVAGLAIPPAVMAPIAAAKMAGGTAASMAAGEATERGLRAVGVPEFPADIAGNVVEILGPAGTARMVMKGVAKGGAKKGAWKLFREWVEKKWGPGVAKELAEEAAEEGSKATGRGMSTAEKWAAERARKASGRPFDASMSSYERAPLKNVADDILPKGEGPGSTLYALGQRGREKGGLPQLSQLFDGVDDMVKNPDMPAPVAKRLSAWLEKARKPAGRMMGRETGEARATIPREKLYQEYAEIMKDPRLRDAFGDETFFAGRRLELELAARKNVDKILKAEKAAERGASSPQPAPRSTPALNLTGKPLRVGHREFSRELAQESISKSQGKNAWFLLDPQGKAIKALTPTEAAAAAREGGTTTYLKVAMLKQMMK